MTQNLQQAIDIIKQFEGCLLKAYKCPAGVWTCGWGNTINVTEKTVYTQAQADTILLDAVASLAEKVKLLIKREINNNQLCACISITYNIGLGAFRNSTLLKRINSGDFKTASDCFMSWVFINKKESQGLKNRRIAEQKLFNMV
jgi:lysozyme